MRPSSLEAIQSGLTTLRELRGITDEEMRAGVDAGRSLMEAGETEGAAEVLFGLATWDPFFPEVWRALEELFRRNFFPKQANFFADLARVMSA
jgi:hypothetical protein